MRGNQRGLDSTSSIGTSFRGGLKKFDGNSDNPTVASNDDCLRVAYCSSRPSFFFFF